MEERDPAGVLRRGGQHPGAGLAPQLTVEEAFFGCIYVAWGRLPER
jgi:hypothetical protein